MTLEDLGLRICIMGPSNSGKSTLADAIARARGLPPVHLDQLRHLPATDWQPRPAAEFIALHDAAIRAPRWIMDGNYTPCLPQRLMRATGVILLNLPAAVSLLRYLRRCWFEQERKGALEGGTDSVKWDMIRYILFTTPADRARHHALFDAITVPKIWLATPRALAAFYRAERLSR